MAVPGWNLKVSTPPVMLRQLGKPVSCARQIRGVSKVVQGLSLRSGSTQRAEMGSSSDSLFCEARRRMVSAVMGLVSEATS